MNALRHSNLNRHTPKPRSLFLRTGLRVLCPAAALVTISCTWTRFSDLLDRSPVQLLTPPSDTTALGLSVAAIRSKSSTLAFAVATSSYAIYEFAKTDLVSADASTAGLCDAANSCWMATSVAAVGQNITGAASACFAFGLENKQGDSPRILLACEGNIVRGLPLPNPAPADLAALTANSKAPRLHLASGPRLAPDLLVAAASASGEVWFYPTGSSAPVSVAKPTNTGRTFGETVAVAGSAATRFIAVGEPAGSLVYLMRTDGVSPPTESLCISSASANFAAAIAAGHYTSAESEDLAIASDDEIVVLPAVDSLPYSTDPAAPCIALESLATKRTLSCKALNLGGMCGGLFSTVALAASDLDSDGRDELVVGTPSAATRGNDAAGKLIVTSFRTDIPSLVQELSPSSAESGDRLGTSVTGVPLSRPEVLLAGAPGGNKLAAFFCTSLLPAGKGGARCD